MRIPLLVRMLVLGGLALCTAVAATALVNHYLFERQLTETLREKAHVVGRNVQIKLERLLALGLKLDEIEGFSDLCRAAAEGDSDISYVLVAAVDGRVLHAGGVSPPERVPPWVAGVSSQLGGKGGYSAVIPVSSGGRVLAAVHAGLPASVLEQRSQSLWNLSLMVALALLCVTGLLLYCALSLWISRPLKQLLMGIERVHRGERGLQGKVDVTSRDEFGDIAKAFNDMVDELARKEDELASGAENLAQLNQELLEDIERRRRAESQLAELAHYDSLTGLPNRELFRAVLDSRIEHAMRYGGQLALMFLDLDRFKLVNDTFGHAAGDELLQRVAERLRKAVRQSDTVARLSGDEFTVMLAGVNARRDAELTASKLLERLAMPISIAGHEFHATTSIGIALFPGDGRDAGTLLKHADTAMYRAKAEGRSNYRFYHPDMSAGALDRLRLESDLRQALPRGEFEAYYLPIMDVSERRVVGAEALLRWRHPEKGLLEPGAFLQVAEDTGLIMNIGRWLLERACGQFREWMLMGWGMSRLAVNLSAVQFRQRDVVADIREVLQACALPPSCLEIELSENTLMEAPEWSQHVLEGLAALGVGVAVDDFGTGSSSLACLKRFPLQRLKVDGSFVRDIAEDQEDRAIVATVIAMAHSLGLKVSAEGVESDAQFEYLQAQGCEEIQGAIVGLPVPYSEFAPIASEPCVAGRG